MKNTWIKSAFLTIVTTILLACGGSEPTQQVDGPNDRFWVGGKADTAGISEDSPDAQAILQLASSASLDLLTDPQEVDLYAKSAEEIVAYREQKGAGFDTLQELDDVPYVGPVAFWKLLGYVQEQGLSAAGGTQIYGAGEPLMVGDYSYTLHSGGMLLKEREEQTAEGSSSYVLWQLQIKADYLAYDSQNDKLVAFGADHLYLINLGGWVEKVFDQGYDDIPNLEPQLLSGGAVCAVYNNLASYYQGLALGAYMVGNYLAGNWYTWWKYYFEGLSSFSSCS